MEQDILINEMVAKTEELKNLFKEVEQRPWTIEAIAVELVAEIGTLADSIMIKEGYRKLRQGQDPIDMELEDDICDVLFVLLMIASNYKINIGESYLKMINSTIDKIIKDR